MAKVCWPWKAPVPLPSSTLTLAELKFAVIMSSLPSPFTSPKVTEAGLDPVANVACAANDGKAVMVAKFARLTPRVPAPVIPVTLTV